MRTDWRDAGVVDRGGLENRYTFGYPGFESLSLRKRKKPETSAIAEVFLYAEGGREFTHRASFYIQKLSHMDAGFFRLQGPCGEQRGSRSAAT